MEQKAKDFIRQSLTRIGELAAHPAAFGVLLTYALLWFILIGLRSIGTALPLWLRSS